ncbi:carbohydrate sulfotransferase 10 isoform X1 [Penaeus vannamei]|uniref:carbohydrate sulfotransferase 10 isoform X1 n=2 Tax=Penaeus vannamei TaxID=6689 RepID=UPI000F65CB89|nr:carbohydrate sulfotransferase 10-like [Penaeus vannamei]
MLNKRRKILLLLCGCSLLLSFYHLRDYEYDKLYEQNVKDNVQELVQRVQKIWILEHEDDSPSTRTPLPETTTLSDATTQRFPVDPGRGKANFTGDKSEVAFPSTTNCSKDQNPKSTRKKGPFVPTLYGYPCRKWQASSPRNRLWPAVLPPSKGSVLEEAYVRFSDSKVLDLVDVQMGVQRRRLQHLTSTCLAHPQLAVRQHLTLVWGSNRSPPIVYCPIYKAASTTWFVYFLRLAHVNDDNPILALYNETEREKKKYMPRFGGGHRRVFEEFRAPNATWEKHKVFRKALRFIVVRHPFARLLSAYRDKVQRSDPRPFMAYFKDLQRAIIAKYRPVNSTENSATPTFPEFIEYLIDSTANLTTAQDWTVNVVCWTPYWVQCGVCSSDYQVVLKLETMAEDEQFLAHVANLKEIQEVHEWRNLKKFAVSSVDLVPEYYKQITKRQMYLLYERYKLDFHLFDYAIDDYLEYAMKN